MSTRMSFYCSYICHYFIFTGKTSEVVALNSSQVKFFITLGLLCVDVEMSLCVRSNEVLFFFLRMATQ